MSTSPPRDGYVLYVHPFNHVQDALVPMGAVALMNRIAAPKLGLHAHELTATHIEGAAVLCMDLHWYFGVEAVNWIATEAKRLRPDLPVVLGGITASFYAPDLLERFPIDYVIQGDAEYTFPRLVDALLTGNDSPELPNLFRRGGSVPARRKVTADEYAENDYLSFDWFPSLERHTFAMHDEYGLAPFWEEMDRYHPYVPLNRGCVFPCESCFGSYQSIVFGSGQVNRSIQAVETSLDRIEEHPRLRFVTFTGGTESVERIGMYRDVFSRRRALGAYVMHFCDLPTDEQLRMYLDAFDRVVIDFTNPVEIRMPLEATGWTTSAAEARIEAILTMLDGEPRARVGLSSVRGDATGFLAKMAERAFESIRIKDAAEWALPAPNKFTLPMLRPANPTARATHARARGAQLDGFREVSKRHANMALGYAVAPALRPLLNEPLPYDDHAESIADVPLDAAFAQPFRAAFRKAYDRWYVTTLARVDVSVWAADATEAGASGAPRKLAGQRPPTRPWHTRRSWRELGSMHTQRTMSGSTLTWRGVWRGGDTLVLCPTLVADDATAFDAAAHPEVELLTLLLSPVPEVGQEIDVAVRATQHLVEVTASFGGAQAAGWRWSLDMFSPAGRPRPPTALPAALRNRIARWVPRAMGADWRIDDATVQRERVYVTLRRSDDAVTLWAERQDAPRGGVAFDRGVEVYTVGETPEALRPASHRMAAVLARVLSQAGRAAP